MIAFARWIDNAKITTARTIPVARAVLPISSCRNVMVKTNNTARFIQRARQRHGDKYDYSQSVWNGADKPITIICKNCGPFTLASACSHYLKKGCQCRCASGVTEPQVFDTESFIAKSRKVWGDKFDYSETVYRGAQSPISFRCPEHGIVTLAQAGTHYAKKMIGCRKCKCKHQRCKCGFEGLSKDHFPHYGKGKCITCLKQEKQEKKDSKKPVCKECGNRFCGRHDKRFCSDECKEKHLSKKKEYRVFVCKVCGKKNEGLEWRKHVPKQVCGSDCQRHYALVQRHSATVNKDWVRASRQASVLHKKKRSKQRLWNNKWFRFAERTANGLAKENKTQDRWEIRCSSASNLLGGRLSPVCQFRLRARINWMQSIDRNVDRIRTKIKRETQSKWMLKCENRATSVLRRRTLRNAR